MFPLLLLLLGGVAGYWLVRSRTETANPNQLPPFDPQDPNRPILTVVSETPPVGARSLPDTDLSYVLDDVRYVIAPRPGDPLPATITGQKPGRAPFSASGMVVWEGPAALASPVAPQMGVVTIPNAAPEYAGLLFARKVNMAADGAAAGDDFDRFLAGRPLLADLRARFPQILVVGPGVASTREHRSDRSRFFAVVDAAGRVTGGSFG